MDNDFQRAVSFRASRMNQLQHQTKEWCGCRCWRRFLYSGKPSQDYTMMRIIWKRGLIRLVLTAGILWTMLILAVLLFHVWSCQSSVTFFSALCNKHSKVFDMLNTMGFVTPPHCCPIPIADYPNKVAIPNTKSPEKFVRRLSYIMEDNIAGNGSQYPLFGGHQKWQQREESFKIKPTMRAQNPDHRWLMVIFFAAVNTYLMLTTADISYLEVHCGFMKGGGAEMASNDVKYVKKCSFVVATGIFDAYDTPHQPSNISQHSQDLFCFLMVVDEVSIGFIKENVTVKEDIDGGLWVGIWRLILLKNQPYDEPRRNGKVPKILTHRLFPEARYSIWIDGKLELIVDPLHLLERYLSRGKQTVCHCPA